MNEVENELLALLLNRNDIIDLVKIKPEWLQNRENQKILKYLLEDYKNFKVVTPGNLVENHSDLNIDYLASLLTEVFWQKDNWRKQLDTQQEIIFNERKKRYIEELNTKLKSGKIAYQEYIKEIKRTDDIKLFSGASELTKNEIEACLSEKKFKIEFKNYSKLNNILRLVQGDFLIIGATTGAGKSGLMINLMCDLMDKYQCIYFNMEMSKSTIYKRLISINANVRIDDIETADGIQKQAINSAIDKIEKSRVIIEHKANDIFSIKSLIAEKKDAKRHTIVFVDHLGLVKASDTRSIYEQTTEVAKELRQICLEYDCTIIGASQLNRGAYSSEKILLSMLKDSGELENSASKVILLYKSSEEQNDYKNKMILDIAKNRDGITGFVNMFYNKEKQIFIE